MEDFATAVSPNGLCTFKLFLHKKTNIFQKMAKTLYSLLLSSFSIKSGSGKQNHYMPLLLS
jgi:hypothetical protein